MRLRNVVFFERRAAWRNASCWARSRALSLGSCCLHFDDLPLDPAPGDHIRPIAANATRLREARHVRLDIGSLPLVRSGDSTHFGTVL
jgi:hypothetical protein